MLATVLFGLKLAPLFSAIAQVESDRGATSSNRYQIRVLYVLDVNRIVRKKYHDIFPGYGIRLFHLKDRMWRLDSEAMMIEYWDYYGYRYAAQTGKPVTYEVLARIHNGGPNGWKKRSTLRYWERVKDVLIHGDFSAEDGRGQNNEKEKRR